MSRLNRRLLIAALICSPMLAHAQATAPRTIKLVVPFPPGGNVDVTARLIAPELAKALGQSVIIENKAGASGTIGLDTVAKAPPDGLTIGLASPINHLAAPSLHPRLPYDSIKDFTPVGLVASVPMVLAVGTSVPASDVQDLIKLAKAREGKMSMASAGSGSGNHIVGELFQDATQVKFVHVPYRGSAPANTDLAGGHVDLHFDQLSSLMPLLQSGRVRALAVTTAKRSPLLPDVPTLAESGVPGFDASTTLGLVLPAGATPDTVNRFSSALKAVTQNPAMREQFLRLGAEPIAGSPEDYAAFIRTEIARTARIVREANITLD